MTLIHKRIRPYLAQDRVRAIVSGRRLDYRTKGAALMVDISGFTTLTENLGIELGASIGAEALNKNLNEVYDELNMLITFYSGSTIYFSGDALTCWFEGPQVEACRQAIACGLKMQQAFRELGSKLQVLNSALNLSAKIAIAEGEAYRFRAGYRSRYLFDVILGEVLDRMAGGEKVAEKGQVVIEKKILDFFPQKKIGATPSEKNPDYVCLSVEKWPGKKLAQIKRNITQNPDPQKLKPWLLPAVFEEANTEASMFFSNQIRSATAIFIKFGKKKHSEKDEDKSEIKPKEVNRYIKWVQNVLEKYKANIIQLTVGDKGLYLYSAFGALHSQADDLARAVEAALILESPPPGTLSTIGIGIAFGEKMYMGAYGGNIRCTYGVLGKSVNLAARLMSFSAENDRGVLLDEQTYKRVEDKFDWEHYPEAVMLKGLESPIFVFRAKSAKERIAAEGIYEDSNQLYWRNKPIRHSETLDLIQTRLSNSLGRGYLESLIKDENKLLQLFENSTGNQRAIEIICDKLIEKNGDWQDALSAAKVEIGQKVLIVFDSCSPKEKLILKFACVVGNAFKLRWLQDVALIGQKVDLSDLEELIEAGFFLKLEIHTEYTLGFCSELEREAIYESIPADQRLHLHDSIGDYLYELVKAETGNQQGWENTLYHYNLCGDADKFRDFIKEYEKFYPSAK